MKLSVLSLLVFASCSLAISTPPAQATDSIAEDGATITTRAPRTPKTVVIDGSRLSTARTKLKTGGASDAQKRSYNSLKAAANVWLSLGPWSVRDKGKAGPNTTSISDYYSMAPYYWPSKQVTKSNPYGCPWVNRDGHRNPVVDKGTDRQAFGKVSTSVPLLALAWFYTGDTRYARHASDIIRTWFINSKTKMNPNLQYAQAIVCSTPGRSIGIIDFAQYYTSILDAVAVLESGSSSETGWTSTDASAFRQWNRQYYSWLSDSAFGKAETATQNNHGVFADMQRAAIALFIGWGNSAHGIVEGVKTNRINKLIASDGRQLAELNRTRSFHYSTFSLVAYTRLAQIGTKVNSNLWTYKGPQGQSIFKAVNFLIPAATGAAKWKYDEMNFTRYAALDVVHSASDAGDAAAKHAVMSGKLAAPPGGDLWYIRPAAEQLDSTAG